MRRGGSSVLFGTVREYFSLSLSPIGLVRHPVLTPPSLDVLRDSSGLTISADEGFGGARTWDSHPEHDNWIEIHELGHGNFSKVVLAKHAYEKGRVAALKIVFVNDPMLDEETKDLLVQEGDILFELSHPNLIKCRNIYPSENGGLLVYELEYLRGPNLLEGIYAMRNTYSEKDASRIFKQITDAVGYLHEHKVIHRDIKPENVVFEREIKEGMSMAEYYDAPVVKVLDLGLAWRMGSSDGGSPGSKTSDSSATVTTLEVGCIGSPGFIAPEIVFDKPHTPAMDVYGLGVLLFIMLVGRKPYDLNQSESLEYAAIPIKDAPGMKDPRWLDLSPDAKHLILGMLREDPTKRMTCKQVLAHEWVRSEGGLTLRHLGAEIAMGAATVGEMRRLKFLDMAVASTMDGVDSRDASISRRSGSRSVRGFSISLSSRGSSRDVSVGGKSGKERYLAALDKSVRRGKSVHGGGVMDNMARSLTAKSYTMAHDAGRSVHGRTLEKSVHGRTLEKSVHGKSGRQSNDRSTHERSRRGGSSGHGLRQLGKAVSGYLEERSVHGRRSGGMSRSSSKGSGLNLAGLATKSAEKNGIQAGKEMNQRWRNSLDGSGSMGRKVRAIKPVVDQ